MKMPPIGLCSMAIASPAKLCLAALQEGHKLRLFGVGIVSSDDWPENYVVILDDIQSEIYHQLLDRLHLLVPLALDYE